MEDHLTDGVELYFLEDSLALFTFDVHVHEVSLVGVNDVAEQDHRRMEMDLVISSVQYTGYKSFIPQFLGLSLAEICSTIPYNLNSFHNGYKLSYKITI